MNINRHSSLLRIARLGIPIGLLAVGIAFFDPLTTAGASTTTTYRVVATIPLNVRSDPNASSTIVGHLNPGASITIECQTPGSFVNGSHIWDKTSGGYVSDYWISTPLFNDFSPGLNKCVAAAPQPAPAPAPTNDRVARALSVANSFVGSTAFDSPNQICDAFVARVYGYRASGEFSAFVHYTDLHNRGLIHSTPNPPAGALVFFGPANPNRYYGHVMVSRGDGTAFSNAVQGRIGITTIAFMSKYSGPYLGWADGPTGFPRGV